MIHNHIRIMLYCIVLYICITFFLGSRGLTSVFLGGFLEAGAFGVTVGALVTGSLTPGFSIFVDAILKKKNSDAVLTHKSVSLLSLLLFFFVPCFALSTRCRPKKPLYRSV